MLRRHTLGLALAALILAAGLCAAPGASRAAEAFSTSTTCNAEQSSPDWDTIWNCDGTNHYAHGALFMGASSATCNSANKGLTRYNTTSNALEFCNGSAWTPLYQVQSTPAITAPSGSGYFVLRLVQLGNPQIESLLGSYTVDNDETRGVRATADGQTQALLSQPMREDELKAGVPLDELGDKPVTVFAVMPHEFVKEGSIHANVLRLWVSAALRSLYRPSSTICTFWLNEFAALGRLGPIESALGLVAGYGIQLVIVVQSLTQLHQLYESAWENFLGQAGAVVLIGAPADKFTADYLSSRSGERTILQPNANMSFNPGGFGLSNGEAYTRRPHLMPQDLYGLQPGYGYVWVAGLSNAIPAYFPPYWDVERLARRARANPYYRG